MDLFNEKSKSSKVWTVILNVVLTLIATAVIFVVLNIL